jgi:L-fucose mutarotase
MLIGLDPLLTADLLHALAAMGHGDTIVLVDANYPATRGRRLIQLPGSTIVTSLKAVLSVLPLDSFVDNPAEVMEAVGQGSSVPPAVADINAVLTAGGHKPAASLERFAFYEAAEKAFAVIATGERRFYGNVILRKGVIPPEAA